MDSYLSKPVIVQDLKDALERCAQGEDACACGCGFVSHVSQFACLFRVFQKFQ